MDKIIGSGLSGMVGSRIIELLGNQFEFEDLSLGTGVDIRDRKIVSERIGQSKARVVLHLAAKTDVDACEKDKPFGEKGDAWQINVLGTKNIVDACQAFEKKMIYVSTDFVFDGQKTKDLGYTEEDIPNPINWYGRTKYEGEKITRNLRNGWLICRIAYPYRAKFTQKKDFVRLIKEKLDNKDEILALTDHVFTPTFIDDIALALRVLIRKEASGIYHLVGSESLTPYEAVCLIVSQFHLDPKLVSCVKMENYYSKDKAARPKNLAIKNEKIKKLGIKMKTFKEGLKEIKRQIQESK